MSEESDPRVFITYAHDGAEHVDQVLRFATLLRRDAGVDVHLDRWYDDGPRDWSAWAGEQIREADFIVAIASPAFKLRTEGLAPPTEGGSVQYEAALIRDNLIRNLAQETRRLLPVVLPGRSVEELPAFLRPYTTTHYVVDELTVEGVGYLLSAIRGLSRTPWPERGRFASAPVRVRLLRTGDEFVS
jgi:SEFIR domain